MECAHLTFSSSDRLPLFVDERLRRLAVRRLCTVVGHALVLFCVVDDHIHVVLVRDGRPWRRLAQSVLFALRPVSQSELQPAHITPVEGRRHLRRLVDYLLGQPSHHALKAHAALFGGSCFPHLVGARALPSGRLQLSWLLPRLSLAEIYAAVGLDAVVSPLDDAAVRGVGSRRIASAAAAAHGVGPALSSRREADVEARRTAAHLARAAGLGGAETGWVLELTGRSVRRLLSQSPSREGLHAARLQLALEEAVRSAIFDPPGKRAR